MFIPHEIFERKPLLGAILGALCLAFCVVVSLMVYREYRGFGKSPERVDLATVVPPPEMRGKWVVVTQPLKVYCQPIEMENQLEHQILFGRVESTYFLAEVTGSQRFVLLQRHKRATCSDVQRTPIVGVLTEINPGLHSSLEGRGLVFPRNKLTMLLCLSCGPKDSRTLLAIFPLIGAASLWLFVRSVQKYERRHAFRESAAFGGPNIS